jgi:pimeloyl-ACP methyl ester carboxylesterase
MSKLRPLASLLALALAGCSGTAPGPQARPEAEAAKRTVGRLEFEPCALSGALATQTLDGMCGTLAVPEDPAKPNGRKIDLRIAWLRPGDRTDPAPDPVFYLAGGPGQAATEYASAVSGALHEVLKSRSVFLVDQRGTGKSAPLDCPKELRDAYKDRDDTAAIAEYAGKCAAALKNDARLFTTTVAVEDLDTVRKALGAEKIDLVGVSYGTRVAQQYAMRHPQQTRAVVLDGVLPNDVVAGGEFARTFERTLTLRGKACAADPVCAKRYPQDLRTQLATLKQRLASAPVEVDYRDPAIRLAAQATDLGAV